MLLAIYIRAKNDVNGNPRRGWLVYTKSGDLIRFVSEGLEGEGSLNNAFNPSNGERTVYIKVIATLDVTVDAYNKAQKNG